MMASPMKHRRGATVTDQLLPPSSALFPVVALAPSPFGIKYGGEEAAAVAMGLLCGCCCPRPAMPRADCGRGRRLPASGGGGAMVATDVAVADAAAAVAGPAAVIAGGIAWRLALPLPLAGVRAISHHWLRYMYCR